MRTGASTRVARRWLSASAAVFAITAGCSDLFGPRARVELLTEEYTFGPCGGDWYPGVPPATRTVVDVRLAEDGRATAPSVGHVFAVRRAGGRIVHRFNVAMVRAEIDVAAVPRLFGPNGVANYVETVRDMSRRNVTLIVFLSRDLTDADVAAVESLGARVLSRLDALEGYIVEVPDEAIPAVRALPGVQSVGADSYLCAG